MPEGDSVAGHARRLESVLVGRIITTVAGTSPSLRRGSGQILDATATAIRTVGKHLIIDFDTGYSIRVHLGMSGRWVVLDRSRLPHGSARLVLSTQTHHVACHSATVDVGRTESIDNQVSHLGPDVLGEFEEEEFLARARMLPGTAMAALLVDQRVLAGIGNVYKSELLFLEGIHPDTPTASASDDQLLALARRAQKLLAANIGRVRSTTGARAREQEMWVYGRAGKPCRRCGTAIIEEERQDRVTYWCPTCQSLP